jgi:hypothetical protein
MVFLLKDKYSLYHLRSLHHLFYTLKNIGRYHKFLSGDLVKYEMKKEEQAA